MRKAYCIGLIAALMAWCSHAWATKNLPIALPLTSAVTATSPIIMPQAPFKIPKLQYLVREQALTGEQAGRLAQAALEFLQRPTAFDYRSRLQSQSLRGHIIRYHVACNNMIPRYGDLDCTQGKTILVSQTGTGGDVISMLREKIITAATNKQYQVAYVIKDGVLSLIIHIPIPLADNLFYYDGGKKLPCQCLRIAVKKVWLNDHWSDTLVASTIFPTSQTLTNSKILNLVSPSNELMVEYQKLEHNYVSYTITSKQPTNKQLLILHDQPIDLDDDDNTDKLGDEIEQECLDSPAVAANQKFDEVEAKPVIQDNVLIYSNGDKYQGDLSKNKPNGEGVMLYANNNKYMGSWIAGKPHDQGTMQYADGSSYTGGWKKGLKEGQGEMRYQTDDVKIGVYIGAFSGGKMHGQGVFTYANGDVYAGKWVKNRFKEGSITYANGGRYDGRLICGEKSRMGIMIYPNQDQYEGDWQEGKCHGFGTMRFHGGASYQGTFVDDSITGQGTMSYPNGNQETGQWLNGELKQSQQLIIKDQGIATWNDDGELQGFIYANGDRYVGGWQNNQPHGLGKIVVKNPRGIYESTWEHGSMQFTDQTKFTNKNGHIYQGEWHNGQPHGIGKVTRVNGEIYEKTVWQHGKLVAIKQFTDSQGNQYEVDWQPNKQGTGKCIFSNGDVYVGDWANGKCSGTGTYTKANGEIQEGRFVNGIYAPPEQAIVIDQPALIVATPPNQLKLKPDSRQNKIDLKLSKKLITDEDAGVAIEINMPLLDKKQALLSAAQNGYATLVELLIEDMTAVEIDSPSREGFIALILAAENGHTAVVKQLITRLDAAAINHPRPDGATALMLAAARDHFEVVKQLMTKLDAAAINHPKLDGITALMFAAEKGHAAVVKQLITKLDAAAINRPGPDKITALMFAAKNGHTAAVEQLIVKLDAAAINQPGPRGITALKFAKVLGHKEVVRQLSAKIASEALMLANGASDAE